MASDMSEQADVPDGARVITRITLYTLPDDPGIIGSELAVGHPIPGFDVDALSAVLLVIADIVPAHIRGMWDHVIAHRN